MCSGCLRRNFTVLSHQLNKRTTEEQLLKRLPYESDLGEDLPEHVYEGKRHKLGQRVYVWGAAMHGALGRESYIKPDLSLKQQVIPCRMQPQRSDFGETHKVVDISCGYGFTAFAVNSKGTASLYGTGINKNGQIGHQQSRAGKTLEVLATPSPIHLPLQSGERIVKVSCGRAHTLALSNKGRVYGLGNNSYGQCGVTVIPNQDYTMPRTYEPIQGLPTDITSIEAGQDTSFFLSASGSVYSCGWGADGQSGQCHYDNTSAAALVGGALQAERVVRLACRADCVVALTASGAVIGWGNNEYQQLSSATAEPQLHTPTRLPLPETVGTPVAVAAAGTACFVVNDRGEVYSWGYGTLGRGPNELFSPTPQLIPPTLLGNNPLSPRSKVVSIACGVHMVGCVTDQGELYTWGKNADGGLGQGHKNEQSFPIKVCLLARVVKASCGVNHMAVIARGL